MSVVRSLIGNIRVNWENNALTFSNNDLGQDWFQILQNTV